jgi:hypothetical protein
MYKDRIELYKKLEEQRESKLLVLVTGDRPGLDTQIAQDILEYCGRHLDALSTPDFPKKISLWLYSRGGETLAGWTIANMIRQFCKEFEVIVFSKAHSTATLISLAADNIVMTKQSTLGPIDPSINSPLNPQLPWGGPEARVPISVENVAGYFELAKKEFGIKDKKDLTAIYLKLSDHVHPVALGNVFRTRTQIQMLAEKLLSKQVVPLSSKVHKKIIRILCSESGSHDYTITRREARSDLGLKVETPSMDLYRLLKQIHEDISNELELNSVYTPNIFLGNDQQKDYLFKRCLVESASGGSYKFISEGRLSKAMTPKGEALQDQRTFEGWRKDE